MKDKDHSPPKLAAPKGKIGLFAGMNVLKKAPAKPQSDTVQPEAKPEVGAAPVPETPVANQSFERPKEDAPAPEAPVGPPKEKKVPFFKNLKAKQTSQNNPTPDSSSLSSTANPPPTSEPPKVPGAEGDSTHSATKEPKEDAIKSVENSAKKSARKEVLGINHRSSNFMVLNALGQPKKQPEKSEEDESGEAGEAGEGEVNLIDNLEFTIPSSTRSQMDDDFMQLNFHQSEPSEADTRQSQTPQAISDPKSGHVLSEITQELPDVAPLTSDLSRTAEAKPKKAAFGFIKKNTEPRVVHVLAEPAADAHKKDDSSILEKINQNLNGISDNSRDEFNSSEIAAERVSFSEKIKGEFRVGNLKPRIDDKFSNFLSAVAGVLAKGNEAMRSQTQKEQAKKQAADKLAGLEKQLEEALAVEDYDTAEQLQSQIDAFNAAMATSQAAAEESEMATSLKEFEREREKMAEEVKKLSGTKIFIKEKMLYFEESESANIERTKKTLEKTRSQLTGELAGKAKALEGAEKILGEKTGELQSQIQASEETLEGQTKGREKLEAEIEELKKRLVQKENELFSLNKEIGETEDKINGIRAKFEPVLGKLRQQKATEEDAVGRLKGALEKTEKSLAENEQSLQSMGEEVKAVNDILEHIETVKTAKSAALTAISRSLEAHFQNLAAFEEESQRYHKVREEIESSLAEFRGVKDQIKGLEVSLEAEKTELQKTQAKIQAVDSAKKEAVKSKNFAQAKHFSGELKDLETAETAKKDAIVALLSELDAKQKQLPTLEKKHAQATQLLAQAKTEFLRHGLNPAKERLQIAEALIAAEEIENPELLEKKAEFAAAVKEIETELEQVQGVSVAVAEAPVASKEEPTDATKAVPEDQPTGIEETDTKAPEADN